MEQPRIVKCTNMEMTRKNTEIYHIDYTTHNMSIDVNNMSIYRTYKKCTNITKNG